MNPSFLKIILLNAVLTTLTFVSAQRDDKGGESTIFYKTVSDSLEIIFEKS
jgi:hypothetical protein